VLLEIEIYKENKEQCNNMESDKTHSTKERENILLIMKIGNIKEDSAATLYFLCGRDIERALKFVLGESVGLKRDPTAPSTGPILPAFHESRLTSLKKD
jgi:hypothetical protein